MLALIAATALAGAPPGRLLEWPEHHVVVEVDTLNDNRLFGLWRLVTGVDGDDFGLTHGASLRVGAVWRGLHVRLEAASDLYAERLGVRPNRDDGRGVYTDQRFADHDRVLLRVESAPPNGLVWGAAAGWEQVEGARAGPWPQASAQQRWLHGIVNDVDPLQATNPRYVDDGRGARRGPVAEGGVGAQGTWWRGPWAIRLRLDAGLRLGTVPHASSGLARVEAMGWWQRHADAFAVGLGVGAPAWWHDRGVELRPLVRLALGHRLVSVQVDVVTPVGDLWALPRYHLPHRKTGRPDAVTVVGLRLGIPVRRLVRGRERRRAGRRARAGRT